MGPLEDTVSVRVEKYKTRNGRMAFKLAVVEV
jgi:hypothetical protein